MNTTLPRRRSIMTALNIVVGYVAALSLLASMPVRAQTNAGPLLSTKWDQGTPYNDACPQVLSQKHSAAGCVAIAMAQILAYYKYPEHGYGEHVDEVAFGGGGGQQLPNIPILTKAFKDHSYRWNNMPDVANGANSDIAQLVVDCGVAVDTNYYTTESTANIGAVNAQASDTSRVGAALTAYFGFASGSKLVQRQGYSNEAWFALIRAEIDARRPVFYDVKVVEEGKEVGGHAFVLDGYKINGPQTMFHLNFGWGGKANGFYSANQDINVEVTNDQGRTLHLTFPINQHRAIIGIRPGNSVVLDSSSNQFTLPPAQRAIQIGFIVGGQLMIQNLENSNPHAAGETGRQLYHPKMSSALKWSDVDDKKPMSSLLSPDGKYKVVRTITQPDIGSPVISFHVISGQSGHEVLSWKRIQTAIKYDPMGMAKPSCYGWLPDSRHVIFTTHSHISSTTVKSRSIIDVHNGSVTSFNGWLASDGKMAVVPAKQGWVDDIEQHVSGDHFYEYGMVGYYAVQMPKQLSAYNISQALRKRLVLNHKLFQISLDSEVEFSADHKWAIIDEKWLVSLNTGILRELPGEKASFITTNISHGTIKK